jgi:hypothetical protein
LNWCASSEVLRSSYLVLPFPFLKVYCFKKQPLEVSTISLNLCRRRSKWERGTCSMSLPYLAGLRSLLYSTPLKNVINIVKVFGYLHELAILNQQQESQLKFVFYRRSNKVYLCFRRFKFESGTQNIGDPNLKGCDV